MRNAGKGSVQSFCVGAGCSPAITMSVMSIDKAMVNNRPVCLVMFLSFGPILILNVRHGRSQFFFALEIDRDRSDRFRARESLRLCHRRLRRKMDVPKSW